LRNDLGSVTGKVYDIAVAGVLQRNPIRGEGISTSVDEVESDLHGEQNRRVPQDCGRGRLANVASREEVIVVPFNFRHAIRVRQACLAAVTVATVAYPGWYLVPWTCLAYF
jgi:hypothetical protein